MSEHNLKVGDELALYTSAGNWERCEIHKISRILASGHMRCGPYTVNKRLTIIRGGDVLRGDPEFLIPDERLIALAERHAIIDSLYDEVDWDDLTDDQLKRMWAIVQEHEDYREDV